ncbi:UPF0061-domain-containing protein [Cylindrobasidium torrendii FP15055 ss-10]|uniref:Selenoprotein O n=1 Tax=Cylindrobasidium torrendii FP15055 ss-10 TaxID=1314674 RepID=A0A0D7BW25_9AGAR|nr:UPF0061-domain-containing protein [Cylindrobasidium torrendii FP15055 ss-10]
MRLPSTITRTMSPTKFRFGQLPLASSSLSSRLTADPASVRTETAYTPSVVRRSRLADPKAHFSYVRPLLVGFPYDIPFPPDPEDGSPGPDKAAIIESWLSQREPTVPVGDLLEQEVEGRRILLSFSPSALPTLDTGNASELIWSPSTHPDEAAKEFISVLGGAAIRKDFEPYALRYSGYQFGSWAGQLGDGRAVTVLSTSVPTSSIDTATTGPGTAIPDTVDLEVQLKGCGRTPYSRTADGLAVTRSSIREYLCSEYMHALGIPTTRALSMISVPDVPVIREKEERACVVARVAPSFVRIGNFQALNPGEGESGVMWFGGGQQKGDLQALRQLGEYVARDLLHVQDGSDGIWAEKLLWEVAERNARMVAAWQAYGFMHGVINTDNVSILGLTIDYGPFAFMDVFDPLHICNHSDDGGRYAYRRQPEMVLYALNGLLRALAPLVGYEKQNGKPFPTSHEDLDIPDLAAKGMALKDSLEAHFQSISAQEYGTCMARRMGATVNDESEITRPLLNLMQDGGWDFHESFRKLAVNEPLPNEEEHVSAIGRATREWKEKWLDTKPDFEKMRGANPRFVLRQWVLEEVIGEVEADLADPETRFDGRKKLAKVFEMTQQPFKGWGAEGKPEKDLTEEEKEERRLCGVGSESMLGFQCSCSS